MNLKNQYGQTPLMFIMGNFVPRVDNNENLSITEYFSRRFSHGNDLLIIDSLLKLGAKFDRAEYAYLLSIIENQKNKNEYVPLCEKIEETLSLISDKNVKREKGHENCYYNSNPEHIYEEIGDNKEKLNSNVHMSRSSSVSSINSDDTWCWDSSGDNDESECLTLSNPQSDDEKGSRTTENGYRSGNDSGQQESKIIALPSCQLNAGKLSIAPKPTNPQTRPQASPTKRMPENKISNPSFNKGHGSGFSSNPAINSIKERMKMFENNTSSSFNRESSFSSVKEPTEQEP